MTKPASLPATHLLVLPVLLAAEGSIAFCALAFEIAMARRVAPHAGMSTDTWTAIIAAFLLAWALGNHLGGLAAGAGRGLLLPAAIATAMGAVAVAGTPALLPWWDGLVLAPAPLATWRIALFAGLPCIPAGLCLGMTTPLLTMAVICIAPGGRAIGAAVAAGAAGSMAGAIAVSWLLLDALGLHGTFAAIALVALAAAAALLLLRRLGEAEGWR